MPSPSCTSIKLIWQPGVHADGFTNVCGCWAIQFEQINIHSAQWNMADSVARSGVVQHIATVFGQVCSYFGREQKVQRNKSEPVHIKWSQLRVSGSHRAPLTCLWGRREWELCFQSGRVVHFVWFYPLQHWHILDTSFEGHPPWPIQLRLCSFAHTILHLPNLSSIRAELPGFLSGLKWIPSGVTFTRGLSR